MQIVFCTDKTGLIIIFLNQELDILSFWSLQVSNSSNPCDFMQWFKSHGYNWTISGVLVLALRSSLGIQLVWITGVMSRSGNLFYIPFGLTVIFKHLLIFQMVNCTGAQEQKLDGWQSMVKRVKRFSPVQLPILLQ